MKTDELVLTPDSRELAGPQITEVVVRGVGSRGRSCAAGGARAGRLQIADEIWGSRASTSNGAPERTTRVAQLSVVLRLLSSSPFTNSYGDS